jgi:hypothetical protein
MLIAQSSFGNENVFVLWVWVWLRKWDARLAHQQIAVIGWKNKYVHLGIQRPALKGHNPVCLL